jgi:DNA end-binding protein Ku
VNLSDEPASTTSFQSTHAIDIFAFVEADEIPFSCFETPYYLAPAPDGERVYALLREALNRTKKIAIAHVVIQARRRLAALIPCGSLLMLNTLRKVDRIASLLDARRQQRNLKAEPLTDKELATAAGLVQSMTQKWDTACNPEVRDAEPAKGATPAPGSGYQAQRNTRPRVRARRTYH